MKKIFSTLHRLTESTSNMDRRQLNNRTRTLSMWEGSFWAVLWGFGESYLVPFAIFLKASNTTIAFIGTAPVLIMAFAHVCGAVLLDRVGQRRPIIFAGFLVQGLAFLPLLFLPAAADAIRIPALLAMTVLAFLSVGTARPSWVSLMGDVVDADKRGSYFSRRERIVMCVMVVATLTGGAVLQIWKTAGKTAFGFAFLFGIAMLGRSIGAILIRHHYDAPMSIPSPRSSSSPANTLRAFTRNSNFIWFTFAFAAINGIFSMAAPFFAVYMLRDLQWSYIQFTLSTVIFMASQTLFIRWWGSLCDRYGTRSVIIAASSLLAPFLAVWVFTKNLPLLLLSQIISGAAWSGLNLAASNFIYDAVEQEGRAKAFSFHTLVCGLFSVTGGILIGSQLADRLPTSLQLGSLHAQFPSSIPLLFSLTAIGCIGIRIILFPRFTEVKSVEAISTARILFQLAGGQPFKELFRTLMARRTTFQKNRQQK